MDPAFSALTDRRRTFLAVCGGVLIPLWIFAALAATVWSGGGFGWNSAILLFVHGYATPAGDAIMVGITRLGGAAVVTPLVAAALLALVRARRRADALFLGVAVAGEAALNALAKAAFHAGRPHLWVSPAPASGYGFPSGHAMGALTLAAVLVILTWPTRWRGAALVAGVAWAAAVGLSRVYLGVHYPSDVLGGWALALAWVVGLRLAWRASLARRAGRPHHPADVRDAADSRHAAAR